MEIQKETRDGVSVISLMGNLLGETYAAPILEAVKESIDTDIKNFVLDLKDLRYINSIGLGTLMSILTRARNNGGDLILVNVPEQLDKLLLITKLNSIFRTGESVDEAVASLA